MKSILIIFLSAIGLSLSAQREKDYSLLWEITGNDISQPSYLFGSMHTQDKRAFEFPDSLLPYLHNCENFAVETNFDSLLTYIMSESDEEDVKKEEYLKYFTEEEYRWLKIKAEEKLGLQLEDVPLKKLILLMDFTPKETKKAIEKNMAKDYSTILDLYLCGIAQKEGKKIHGLESLDDYTPMSVYGIKAEFMFDDAYQDALLNSEHAQPTSSDIYNKSDSLLSKMFEYYLAGDIESITTFDDNYGEGEEMTKLALSDRNVKMVASMEKIMTQSTLFTVVGAAHLGGKLGIVELMRQRGYTLKRVIPTFTGKCHEYKSPELQTTNFIELADSTQGYSILLPGVAAKVKIESLADFEQRMVMNLERLSMFLVLSKVSENPDYKGHKAKQTAFQAMAKNSEMRAAYNGLKLETLERNEEDSTFYAMTISGKEDDKYVLTRFMLSDYGLYMLIATDTDSLTLIRDFEKVKQSFKTFAPKPKETSYTWRTIEQPEFGFSISAPCKLKEKKDDFNQFIETNFVGVINGKYYRVGCVKANQSTYSDEKALLKYAIGNITELLTLNNTKEIRLDSFSFLDHFAYKMTVPFTTDTAILVSFQLKDKVYTIATTEYKYADTFLNGFKLIPFPNLEFPARKNKVTTLSGFDEKGLFSSKKSTYDYDYDNFWYSDQKQYERRAFADENQYDLSVYKLENWICVSDTASFLQKIHKVREWESERIKMDSLFHQNNQWVREIKEISVDTQFVIHRKINFAGDGVVLFKTATFPIKSDASDKPFFDYTDFQFYTNKSKEKKDCRSAKQELQDSLIFSLKNDTIIERTLRQAQGSEFLEWTDVNEKKDFHLKLFNFGQNKRIGGDILRPLTEKCQSSQDLPWIIDAYKQYSEDSTLAPLLLNTIVANQSVNGLIYALNLLQSEKEIPDLDSYYFYTMDSAKYNQTYPLFINILSNNSGNKHTIVRILDQLAYLQSEATERKMNEDAAFFENLFKENLAKYTQNTFKSETEKKNSKLLLENIIQLFVSQKLPFNDKETIEKSIEICDSLNAYTFTEFLRNNSIEIPKKIWNNLDIGNILYLLEQHPEIADEKSFPKKKYSQEVISKNIAYNRIISEEEYYDLDINDLKLVKKIKKEYKNELGIFYIYSFQENNEETENEDAKINHLIISGPFSTDKKNWIPISFYGSKYSPEGEITEDFINTSIEEYLKELSID